MALSPEEIEDLKFSKSVRGYDRTEVDRFLQLVATSTRELHGEINRLSGSGDSGTAGATAEGDPGGLVLPVTPDATLADPGASADTEALEMAIIDRYGALGDRIAELLRSADESAATLREAAEADAAQLRADAEAEAESIRRVGEESADEIRANAEAEAAQIQASAEEESSHLLSEARAIRDEADQYQTEAQAAADELQADAETMRIEALAAGESAREQALADVTSQFEEREAATAELERAAAADRDAARAELADVHAQVSGLLEQARAQSEFIKQEAEEIIRTKVRANMENAQARIDVLRNTEVASRERIVLAQRELESALTRLDSEEMPVLDRGMEAHVLDEAEQRSAELGYGADPDSAYPTDSMVETTAVEHDAAGSADVAPASESDQSANGHSHDDRDPLQELGEHEALAAASAAGAAVTETEPVAEPSYDELAAAGDEAEPEFSGGDSDDRASGGFSPDAVTSDDSTEPPHNEFSNEDVQQEEDALARLVREAMQEVVDTARNTD